LVIISYRTGLSFALERIGTLAAITIIVFYLLVLYLLALPNTPENPFASIYSGSLIKTTCQHLPLLVGFDTLIYRKYYDTPPILVGHHSVGLRAAPLRQPPGSEQGHASPPLERAASPKQPGRAPTAPRRARRPGRPHHLLP
jgi:hypothetical protein